MLLKDLHKDAQMLNRYDFYIIWTSMENHKSNFRTVVDKVAILCSSRS